MRPMGAAGQSTKSPASPSPTGVAHPGPGGETGPVTRHSASDEARSEQLWHSVLRTVADPIIVIDETGTVQLVNPAVLELFGYEEQDLVGSDVSILMPEPHRSGHAGYIRRYLDSGDAHIIGIGREVEAQRADGSTFPVSLAVSEVVTGDGRLFTGVMHDLTTRHAAQAELTRANETLEEQVAERTTELERSMTELARSNRDLEQFAYTVSHDLQAPLRNVRQGLELLGVHLERTLGRGFDSEAVKLQDLVFEAVDTMDNLITGLLSYSRIHRTTRPPTAVDLERMAELVIEQLRVDLDEAGVTVETESLPTVLGDEIQLRQLLQNLIQNAVKYRAPDRSPIIRIRAEKSDTGWLFSITDNGIGVDPMLHERIFELFSRGHPGYDGVGLGLALCQRIVERHGGTIWVESEPERGATFNFTLPADVDWEKPPEDDD